MLLLLLLLLLAQDIDVRHLSETSPKLESVFPSQGLEKEGLQPYFL